MVPARRAGRAKSVIASLAASFLLAVSPAAADEGASAPRLRVALSSPQRLRQGDLLVALVATIEAPTDIPAGSSAPEAATAVPAPASAVAAPPSSAAVPAAVPGAALRSAPAAATAPGAATAAASAATAPAASSAATAGRNPAASSAADRDPAAAPPRLRLLAPDGSIAAETTCFAVPSILEAPRPDAPAAPVARAYGAILPLAADLAPGSYTLAADCGELGEAGASLLVEARDFPLEVIGLDEANSALRARPTKRQQAEARKLFALLGKTEDAAVYASSSPFLFPVEGGFKSAGFGDRRRFLLAGGGVETSFHAGLDWGVVKGTAVRSCERGKVVMVADRELTGKTVVVEHLPGLYSLYFHLSAAAVREGEFVERGQLIARSGSTGLSTGPHLHWELRAKGAPVDPEPWLTSPLLDKEAIKATIDALIEGR